jgi:hypothetical protein
MMVEVMAAHLHVLGPILLPGLLQFIIHYTAWPVGHPVNIKSACMRLMVLFSCNTYINYSSVYFSANLFELAQNTKGTIDKSASMTMGNDQPNPRNQPGKQQSFSHRREQRNYRLSLPV